ncbi:MAG: DUF1559 domain-containing protein, partial [Planctomycetaceae bacterium]|nr:DUF1559 domain-containing protein [Planctomycetaceae bacterium]
NVSMAMLSYASSHNGELPDLVDPATPMAAHPTSGTLTPWSVTLLPLVDSGALYEQMVSATPTETFDQLASKGVAVYNCPADLDRLAPGAMSYVVNGGYMTTSRWNSSGITGHTVEGYDWQADGTSSPLTDLDKLVTMSTGVIWAPGASGLRSTLDRVRDGQAQTLLLSENLDVGSFNSSTDSGGWSSLVQADLCFALPIKEGSSASVPADRATDANGFGNIGTAAAPDKANALRFAAGGFSLVVGTTAADDFSRGSINARLNTAPVSASPRPSSLHPQAVNVIFCDGSGRAISDSIADVVYAQLISSNGSRLGQPVLSDNDF